MNLVNVINAADVSLGGVDAFASPGGGGGGGAAGGGSGVVYTRSGRRSGVAAAT